jgi:hypothetical protein
MYAGEDSDVDCCGLFEELHVFAAVIHLIISNIKGMFQFIIRGNLGEVYPSIFILLRTITTLPLTTASAVSLSRLIRFTSEQQ